MDDSACLSRVPIRLVYYPASSSLHYPAPFGINLPLLICPDQEQKRRCPYRFGDVVTYEAPPNRHLSFVISVIYVPYWSLGYLTPYRATLSCQMASPESSTSRRATAANGASPSTTARRDPDTVTTRQLKKRELDRKAQRLARERTKTRITSLEKLVADLQHKDTSDQVRALTKSLQAVTKERDVALGLLRSLGSSINQHLSQSQDAVTFDSTTSSCNRKSPDTTMDDAETAPIHSVTDDFNAHPNDGTTGNGTIQAEQGPGIPICSLEHPDVPEFINPPTDAVGSLLDDLLPGFPPVDNILQTIPNEGNDPISPASMPGCGCYPQDQLRASSDSLNLWRFANEVLSTPSQLNRDSADFDETWQDDLPVRAVVEGWSAAEAKLGRLPALWLKLRPIDEVLFHGCGKAERVAMLRIMHDLLLYHLDPSTERRATLPPWYLER